MISKKKDTKSQKKCPSSEWHHFLVGMQPAMGYDQRRDMTSDGIWPVTGYDQWWDAISNERRPATGSGQRQDVTSNGMRPAIGCGQQQDEASNKTWPTARWGQQRNVANSKMRPATGWALQQDGASTRVGPTSETQQHLGQTTPGSDLHHSQTSTKVGPATTWVWLHSIVYSFSQYAKFWLILLLIIYGSLENIKGAPTSLPSGPQVRDTC